MCSYLYYCVVIYFLVLKATHNIIAEGDQDQHENFVNTQTYDLFITYDKFYQTPRLWISGYDTVQFSYGYVAILIRFINIDFIIYRMEPN